MNGIPYNQSLNLAAITLPIPPPKPKSRISNVVYAFIDRKGTNKVKSKSALDMQDVLDIYIVNTPRHALRNKLEEN